MHVHVASADALLVRDHPELRADAPIPVGVGDRELVRRHLRQSQGEQPDADGLRGLRRRAPQRAEFLEELGARRRHTRGGFHLATAQFEIQCDAAVFGLRSDRDIAGGGFASPRVNEEEFLLHTNGGKIAQPAR